MYHGKGKHASSDKRATFIGKEMQHDDASSVSSTELVSIKAYLAVWCIAYTLPVFNAIFLGPGVGGLDERPLVYADYYCLLPLTLVLFSALLLGASMPVLVIPLASLLHIIDLAIRWNRLPHVWDHEQWACQVELAFVVVFAIPQLFQTTAAAASEAAFLTVFRLQFAMLYAAATFWKINTSFLNVKTSCGTVLILELLGTYLPEFASENTIQMLANMAPHITLITEISLGILMLLGVTSKDNKTLYRHASVHMGTGFHLSIFLMPVNGAGGFSMDCMRHFILFYEPYELNTFRILTPLSVAGYAIGTATLLRLRYNNIGLGFDFCFVGMCLLLCFYLHLSLAARDKVAPKGNLDKLGKSNGGRTVLSLRKILPVLVLFVTFCYAYIGPVLGIQHMGAPTMYSNMRYYFGGNHLWAPTSVLPDDILFGGGLVQVLRSTCTQLNYRLGHIPSKNVFPFVAMKYFEKSIPNPRQAYQLFPLCVSNPHAFEVLRGDYEHANPSGSENFAPFIIPIAEVRKALSEAATSAYSVTLTRASSYETAVDSTYIVLDSADGCKIVTPYGESTEETCEKNDLARKIVASTETPVAPLLGSYWLAERTRGLRKRLLTPYPQLVGWEEEMCMS